MRGTIRTRGLPPALERIPGTAGPPSLAACAASTAARTSESDMSTGTTMPGSTTSSSRGRTGSVAPVCASLIEPSMVESLTLNKEESELLPALPFAVSDHGRDGTVAVRIGPGPGHPPRFGLTSVAPVYTSRRASQEVRMAPFPPPTPIRRLAAVGLPLVLLAGGCAYLAGEEGGGADPDSAACEPYAEWQDIGGTVEIYGSIRDEEGERLEEAWSEFSDCTGIEIAYEGSGEFEAQIQVKVDGGNAPDIGIFPQPGLLARFVESGDALPLPEGARERAEQGWTEDWLSYVEH